jgi:beta-glucosidase
MVGIAHHVRVFQPATESTLDATVAALSDAFSNEAFPEAVRTGRARFSIPGEIDVDEPIDGLAGSFDFLGINYYSRDTVRADLGDPALSHLYVPAGRPVNDLGWDIYPDGFYALLMRFGRYGWPIYVTENGIDDRSGDVRPDFLRTHFLALERAAKDGVDVRGYYHWSLIDNFEWADGFVPQFGLFRVDRGSPAKTRTPTPAVGAFRQIAENLGLRPTP